MTTIVKDIPVEKGSFWAVTLLVSGTCIGGGMLALPIQTGNAGFFTTLLGLCISWAFMTFTGLLLVEATLWVKNETHFTSLSRILIGKKTRMIALAVYLFMNYTSLVGYTAGGASLIGNWFRSALSVELPYEVCCILYTAVFGSMIAFGSYFVGKINFWLMAGLGIVYLALVSFGIGYVDSTNLVFRPGLAQGAGIFSMILATFSYQMVVPSLCFQLGYDGKKMKKAILLGTSFPAIVYALWVLVIHGIVPLEGANGLQAALERGASATEPLRSCFNHWSLGLLADLFALFAIVTSYLGLSLALFYFLKDSFGELNIRLRRITIILASLIPTVVLAMLFPSALVRCLDMSGGYGDTILSGLIPISMVWMGRYRKGLQGEFTVPGGKPALIIAALFYGGVFLLQML